MIVCLRIRAHTNTLACTCEFRVKKVRRIHMPCVTQGGEKKRRKESPSGRSWVEARERLTPGRNRGFQSKLQTSPSPSSTLPHLVTLSPSPRLILRPRSVPSLVRVFTLPFRVLQLCVYLQHLRYAFVTPTCYVSAGFIQLQTARRCCSRFRLVLVIAH